MKQINQRWRRDNRQRPSRSASFRNTHSQVKFVSQKNAISSPSPQTHFWLRFFTSGERQKFTPTEPKNHEYLTSLAVIINRLQKLSSISSSLRPIFTSRRALQNRPPALPISPSGLVFQTQIERPHKLGASAMTELFRLVEQPRTCSYLPAQTASLEVRAVKEVSPAEYGEMLSRGWRRFGWQFFRPACPHCRECRSIRVLAQQFQASTGQRRVMRKNEGVRAQLHPLFVVSETVDLYNRYQRFMHEHRGWQ